MWNSGRRWQWVIVCHAANQCFFPVGMGTIVCHASNRCFFAIICPFCHRVPSYAMRQTSASSPQVWHLQHLETTASLLCIVAEVCHFASNTDTCRRPTGTIRSHWTLCWRLPGPHHLSRSAHLAPLLPMAPKRSPANSSCGSSSWSGTRQHRSQMMVSTNSCSHGACACA